MIPRVARGGRSFKGAAQYYLHDKILKDAQQAFAKIGDYVLHDKTAKRNTAERVGFTEILNMDARSPEEAIAQMTASYDQFREREAHKRGRKLLKPVYAYSLSWSPDQAPSKEDMMKAALSSLKALRLEGLQTLVVQHTDEPHPHIHIIVNRIEPDGQRARNIPFDKLRLSSWALEYEREQGRVYCERRLKHSEMRRRGIYVKDRQPRLPQREQPKPVSRTEHLQQAIRRLQTEQNLESLRLRRQQRRELEAITSAAKAERAAFRHRRSRDAHWERVRLHYFRRSALLNLRSAIKTDRLPKFVQVYRKLLAVSGPTNMKDVFWLTHSPKLVLKRVSKAFEVLNAEIDHKERSVIRAGMASLRRKELENLIPVGQRHELERDWLAHGHNFQKEEVLKNPPPFVRVLPAEQKPAPVVPGRAVSAPPKLQQGREMEIATATDLLKDQPVLHDVFNASTGNDANAIVQRAEEYRRRNRGSSFGLEL